MTFVAVSENGFSYVLRLSPGVTAEAFNQAMELQYQEIGKPWSGAAPLETPTGALLAQADNRDRDLRHCATWVSAPALNPNGAPSDAAGPVANGSGAKLSHEVKKDPRVFAAEKIEYYRSEIKGLTAEKVSLAPIFDAHQAVLKACREALHLSHSRYPAIAVGAVQEARLRLHDQIVASSSERGRDARRYREVSGLIDILTTEIERLERKVSA